MTHSLLEQIIERQPVLADLLCVAGSLRLHAFAASGVWPGRRAQVVVPGGPGTYRAARVTQAVVQRDYGADGLDRG